MCEYCGCQAVPAIALLTVEHDRALDLVRDIATAARAGKAGTVRSSAGALADLLAPHTAVEEQALFPALAGEFPDHIGVLRAEHVAIEKVLDEMTDGEPAQPGWQERLQQAMDLLSEHIFKEQDGVFPAALTVLAPDDWDRLDEVRQRVTSAGPDDPLCTRTGTRAVEQTETASG